MSNETYFTLVDKQSNNWLLLKFHLVQMHSAPRSVVKFDVGAAGGFIRKVRDLLDKAVASTVPVWAQWIPDLI